MFSNLLLLVVGMIIMAVILYVMIEKRAWIFANTIIPKYKQGQRLWYFRGKRLVVCFITQVDIKRSKIMSRVNYVVEFQGEWAGRKMTVPEYALRTTKELKQMRRFHNTKNWARRMANLKVNENIKLRG